MMNNRTGTVIVALFTMLFLSTNVLSQEQQQPESNKIEGAWIGTLNIQGTELPLAFHMSHEADAYKALMDSPKQGVTGIPSSSVTFIGSMLNIVIENAGIEVSGILRGNTITAVFKQSGLELPLVLTRTENAPKIQRPQEPQPPYPYIETMVEFPSAAEGITMHGTLTIPKGDGPFTAVVMVTGSGTQNRDEELFSHKPFKVIADYLTRHGIAVLRYDDREMTTRSYNGATTRDYAADALNAVEFLKTQKGVDNSRIGIIGHSEGGTIAFICAAKSDDIAFIVSLAGMTIAGEKCLLAQNRLSLKNSGLGDAETDRVCELVQATFEQIKLRTVDDLTHNADAIVDDIVSRLKAQDIPSTIIDNMKESMRKTNEWIKYFVSYDPADDISRTKCDILALNGSLDTQVIADDNLTVLANCHKTTAGQLTTHKYEGLNHLFQHCTTGGIQEYGLIEETFAPEVLADISDWILARKVE